MVDNNSDLPPVPSAAPPVPPQNSQQQFASPGNQQAVDATQNGPPLADGPQPLNTYAVTIPLPRKISRIISQVRDDLDTHTNYELPHIPMIIGAAAPGSEKIQSMLHSLVQDIDDFEVILHGSGTFMPEANVTFMPVAQGARELFELYEILLNFPWFYNPAFKFTPHVSLLRGCSAETQEYVMEQLAEATFPFVANRLDLYEILPHALEGTDPHRSGNNWIKIDEIMF